MADNVAITPGAGATVATDDIGGVQYQRVKVALGADGSATDLSPGQKAMSASVPVVLASDHSAVPVTAAALPLPAGAATDAAVTALSGKFNSLGQKSSAGSAPVVIASDQSAILATVSGTVSISGGLSLPTGAATETTLAAINTKTPALGQAAAASSVPVALANEQILDQYVTGQGSQTALGNNVILAVAGSGSTDCQQYRSVAITITPAAGTVTAGNITFEASNDLVNFVALPLYDLASPNNLPITTYAVVAATTRYFAGTALFRYIRARISTGVTGTTTGLQAFTILSMAPFYPAGATQVVNQTAANLNVTVAANAPCNLAQIAGTTTVTAGLVGMLAVGGNVAAGVTPTANPVLIAGVDGAATPLTRRLLTDTSGPSADLVEPRRPTRRTTTAWRAHAGRNE
jgi:hypothetical protein